MNIVHVPVMREEVLRGLNLKKNGIYIDATLGLGGHAEGILQDSGGCTLVGIDRDGEALAAAKERLQGFENVYLARDKFSHMKGVAAGFGVSQVDGILLDLGVSTLQLKDKGRGFSFLKDEPLDMRMNPEQELTAGIIVNTYPEKQLADIIWKYGEERNSRRIARALVRRRCKKPVLTCRELADIIEKTIGRRGRIHPATRTFQALRIEVNSELDELSMAVENGAQLLKEGGRLCVISYHSLEDRIVKHAYKRLAEEGMLRIITKKPLRPEQEEIKINPSSRSAKLRVSERI
jgi:16S rRNA (cytosine1402-N4)-methyltransferase